MSGQIKQKIFLNISDIASYIGQNKWDYVTPFERLFKRVDSEGYHKVLKQMNEQVVKKTISLQNIEQEKVSLQNDLENKRLTKRQFAKSLSDLEKKETKIITDVAVISSQVDSIKLTQSEQIQKKLGHEIISKISNANIDTDVKREETLKLVEELKLDDKQKQELLKTTESFINKTHGTLKEDSGIAMYEKKFNVKLDVSQEYNKAHLAEMSKNSKYDWYIGGKVDGLLLDKQNKENSYVVEVKSRTKGFFNSLRDYEKTQIQLYMWMLGLSQGKLVEKYNQKIRITLVQKDTDYIQDILDNLSIFTNSFETKFLNSFDAKTNYIQCSQESKKIYLTKLYLSDIAKSNRAKLEIKLLEKESEADCLIDDLDDF